MLIVDRYWYSPSKNAAGGRLSPLPPRRRPQRKFVTRRSPSPSSLTRRSPSPIRRSPSPLSSAAKAHLQRDKKLSALPFLDDLVSIGDASFLPILGPDGRLPAVPEGNFQHPRAPPKDAGLQRPHQKEGAWQWALRGGLCNKFGDPQVDNSGEQSTVSASSSTERTSRASSRTAMSPTEVHSVSRVSKTTRKHRPSNDSKQICLLPSKASEKRRRFRKALRTELEEVESVEALDEAVQEVSSIMRKSSWEGSGTCFAQLLNGALWNFDPGVLHSVWKGAVQQVLDQEVRRRRQGITAEQKIRDLQPKAYRMSQDNITSIEGALRRMTMKDSPEKKRCSTMRRADTTSDTDAVEALANAQREKVYRTAFGRISQAFRLRQSDLPKALEFSGVPYPNKAWVEEISNTIIKTTALTADEFVKFVRAYLDRQLLEYSKTFQRFDGDNSGTIDISELSAVLKSFAIEPLPHVLADSILEVDDDRSGGMNLEEFVQLLEILNLSSGFSRTERNELAMLHKRFDRKQEGNIPTDQLAGILSWLGYSLKADEVWAIAEQVDVDSSGSLDYYEFLMCMRKVREREIRTLRTAIRTHDVDGNNSLNESELEPLLHSLGYIADSEAIADSAKDSEVNLQSMQFEDLWKFVQVYRSREGLSCAQCAEVDAAFERYDNGKGEISTVDIGKAFRWFGYQVPYLMQLQITEEVDVDKTGRLDRNELRKLIRMYWEQELTKMQQAFSEHCDKNGRCTPVGVEQAFQQINFVDGSCKAPVVPVAARSKAGVDQMTFMSAGIKFKQEQRVMFRESAGYKHNEVAKMQELFNKYDNDHSDSIGTNELGALIRHIFPVLNKSIRSQLDQLMKEIDADGPGSGRLAFDDFLRTMRQFHDIQNQERVDKMERIVAETGFSQQEVRDFNDLFQASDLNLDGELSETEVRHMIQNVCPLGDRNGAELHRLFMVVHEKVSLAQGQKLEGSHDSVDLPEFLLLMRMLLDNNFANIQARLGVNAQDSHHPRKSITIDDIAKYL